MKPIHRYLDEAIDRQLGKNDSDIARKLGVSRATVSDWRVGRTAPNEDQAAALADLIGKPEILAECMAARARRPETRATWERAARMLSSATLCACLFGVVFSPTADAKAIEKQDVSGLQFTGLQIIVFSGRPVFADSFSDRRRCVPSRVHVVTDMPALLLCVLS